MVFLMKYARGWAMVLLLGCAPAALSQFIVLPSPLAGVGNSGFGIGLSKHGRHSQLSAYFTGGSGYYSSYYGYPYYPVGVSRVTVVQVVTPPRVVVAPPAGADAERGPAGPRPEVVEPPDEKPMPGNAGGFQPVRPPMPPPPKEKPKEKPKEPPPPEKPKEPPPAPEPPRPPRPAADPGAESARQRELGQDAFAAAEYGRAAQRFRQAIHVQPNAALPYFLLAQAEVALGKYDQAVSAIQAGMRLEPDWPSVSFRPVTLYGDNVTDLPEHLQALEDALGRQPDDPALLFLFAYELWFDGRRDEARPLFERAAVFDKTFSERFLLARPDRPGL
jgi:Tetratricopeptide repeat